MRGPWVGVWAGVAALLFLGACEHLPLAPPSHEVRTDAPYIVAAVNDARRTQGDHDSDALRKPADMLAFAEVRPGQKIADLFPGGGYFTRLFAVAVGPQGHVYSVNRVPPPTAANPPAIVAVGAQYPNDTVMLTDINTVTFPEPLDLVWTSRNYHDWKIARNNIDTAQVDRAVFNALKPGGVFIVLDHSAPDGSGVTLTEQLHRIDQAYVRHEVEAAGFVYDGETQVLRNPADNRTTPVFDAAIRAHTDQFVMRFRKPG